MEVRVSKVNQGGGYRLEIPCDFWTQGLHMIDYNYSPSASEAHGYTRQARDKNLLARIYKVLHSDLYLHPPSTLMTSLAMPRIQ